MPAKKATAKKPAAKKAPAKKPVIKKGSLKPVGKKGQRRENHPGDFRGGRRAF